MDLNRTRLTPENDGRGGELAKSAKGKGATTNKMKGCQGNPSKDFEGQEKGNKT